MWVDTYGMIEVSVIGFFFKEPVLKQIQNHPYRSMNLPLKHFQGFFDNAFNGNWRIVFHNLHNHFLGGSGRKT